MSTTYRCYYESLTVVLSVPGKSGHYREVSATGCPLLGGFTVFLILTYFELIEGGVCHLLILIPHLYTQLSTKYPREKNSVQWSTHKKNFWTHIIASNKYFRPTKYLGEKIWDPRNTSEIKLWTHEKKFRSNETPAKKVGPTK